jgi:gluconolactonase
MNVGLQGEKRMEQTRRGVLAAAGGLAASIASGASAGWEPAQRYPDPAVEILDPSFTKYRIYSSTLEQLATGMRWAEGPVYFPEERYLLVSDIPNNRIMKYDEVKNTFTVFREPSNYANGNTRDRQGRLLTCEHSATRRVTRTEKTGAITVLADNFEGKRLNASNDIVVKSDNTIWFTDPLFGGRVRGPSPSRPPRTSTGSARTAS